LKRAFHLLHRTNELLKFGGGAFNTIRVDHSGKIAVAVLAFRSDLIKRKKILYSIDLLQVVRVFCHCVDDFGFGEVAGI
jgi:hypothetical protein